MGDIDCSAAFASIREEIEQLRERNSQRRTIPISEIQTNHIYDIMDEVRFKASQKHTLVKQDSLKETIEQPKKNKRQIFRLQEEK